jgi:hypothetical protein
MRCIINLPRLISISTLAVITTHPTSMPRFSHWCCVWPGQPLEWGGVSDGHFHAKQLQRPTDSQGSQAYCEGSSS